MPDRTRKKLPPHRPPHEPTDASREMVVKLAGLLVSHKAIARDWLKITEPTLLKYYQAELDNGRDIVASKIKAVIFNAAMHGSLRACSYLGDRLGLFPQPENGGAQAPAQVIVRVHGGIAAVEGDKPPGGLQEAANE